MATTTDVLERVAREILCEAGLGGPVDVYMLALWAGCEVRMGSPGMRPCLLGRTIVVPPGDPPERQRFSVGHELSHLFLRARGLNDCEWNADYLASALLHPREWFLERLAARGWDLAALRKDCVYSSHEAIGRRIVNLHRAVLWVCDRSGGPNTKRRSHRARSKDTHPMLARATQLERAVVKRTAETLTPHRDGPVAAWPLPRPDNGWLRVISIADADALVALGG